MKAAVGIVLLLAAAYPLEQSLRKAAPATAEVNRIGMGRLLGGVLTGPFRPMLQTYLWIRADILFGQGRFDEQLTLYRTMTALYPNNQAAREYLGWHICFNLKNEAPAPELVWVWSKVGIDILADVPRARRVLADWFLKQCGQDPVAWLRYTGDAWEREKHLRARVRDWAKQRYGEELRRFDLGLKTLGDEERFFDQLRRLSLLTFGAYDDCLRAGESDKFEPARKLALWTAEQLDLEGVEAPEGWKEHWEERAWALRELAAKRPSERLLNQAQYGVAVSFWGFGAHGRDLRLLQAAELGMRAFQAAHEVDCAAELAAIAAWIRYVRDPSGPRPPLPFD